MQDPYTTKAQDLPFETFLPCHKDWVKLRQRMVIIVQRILVQQFDCLNTKVTKHVPHLYSEEMCKKSHVVSLGAIDANPASNDGKLYRLH